MQENKINASLSPDAKAAITAAIQTIKNNLPFLISLTPEQIKNLNKLGPGSQDFVNKAMEIAQQNIQILPREFDINEMAKDVNLFQDLTSIRISLEQLLELVISTQILAGSEAIGEARTIYNQIKVVGKGSGLETAAAELGKRYARPKSSKKPPKPSQ